MDYQYEVAISFAGENRKFAEAVAQGLRKKNIDVFYDDYYKEDLWGEDLSVKFRDIFYSSSRYCIMILSEHYLNKMWTRYERQQAVERLIREEGNAYILPVRLDGFRDEVPGLPGTIQYLSANSSEPEKLVEAFLRKIGRSERNEEEEMEIEVSETVIPSIRKEFTDREKNNFLKTSYEAIVGILNNLADKTKKKNPDFDYEIDKITSRKIIFTFYNQGNELTKFKIWISGMFGENSISLLYGRHIDLDNDSSSNESLHISDEENELRLKPMGMAFMGIEREKTLNPKEAAEYIWEIVCRNFS